VAAAREVAETGAVGSEAEAGMAVAANMIVSVRAEMLVSANSRIGLKGSNGCEYSQTHSKYLGR
jgi:hypothetical protein